MSEFNKLLSVFSTICLMVGLLAAVKIAPTVMIIFTAVAFHGYLLVAIDELKK